MNMERKSSRSGSNMEDHKAPQKTSSPQKMMRTDGRKAKDECVE